MSEMTGSQHEADYVVPPEVALSRRLMSVRNTPGFLDVLRISQQIVDSATAIVVDYGGCKGEEIMLLKIRAQAAKEHHALLISKINAAIEAGIAAQNALDE